MAFSIRTRLTFWYVTLLTVSLLAFGGAFTYSLFRIFTYKIDEQISSVADMMVHTVVNPTGELFLPGDFDIILERFFGVRTSGNVIQVVDLAGNVVAKSSNLERGNIPLSKETFHHALNGVTTFEVVRKVGRYPMRIVTKPISVKGRGVVAIVQVGSSLESFEDIFHAMAYIFAVGFFASILIAGGVGWFLARKALKPVTDITRTARRIGAQNLNERIKVAASQDEIGRLASTINEMIERLERSFNQIKQFTGDASHELKTPLTILKGEMEMALRSADDVEYMKEVLKSGLEEIDRMSYIVRNLLDLAKFDAEKEALRKVRVSVDKIVSDRVEHFSRLAQERGISLSVRVLERADVHGDEVKISQMLFNLIDNALKYTPAGGRVAVSVEKSADSAIVRVEDTGIGISKEDQPYIFDRFYRVDKARSRDAGGAGLGLSICKEIVDMHMGTVSVESAPGSGTAFTVRLPLAGKEEE